MKTTIMKAIFVLICTIALPTFVYAQSFTKATKIISAGIGLGTSFYQTSGNARPAISANFEKGAFEVGDAGIISLGGYIGNSGYKDTYSAGSYSWEAKYNYTVIGVRSAYHYGELNNDKFDLYGGLMLSYNLVSYKYSDNDPSYDYDAKVEASGIGFTGYVGGRYNFSEKLGAFAELGYGVSTLSFGLSLKF